jgi:hypothetical protein
MFTRIVQALIKKGNTMTNGVTGPKFGMATTYSGKAITTTPEDRLGSGAKDTLGYYVTDKIEDHFGSDAQQAKLRAEALTKAGINALVVPVPDGPPVTVAEAFSELDLKNATQSGRAIQLLSGMQDLKVQPNNLYVVDGDHMKAIQTARTSAEQQIAAEKALAPFKDPDAIKAAISEITEGLAKTVKEICVSFLKK